MPRSNRRRTSVRLQGVVLCLVLLSCSDPEVPDVTLYALTIATGGAGTGSVQVTPATLPKYPANTPVTLNAVAAPGSSFTRWEGDCTGTTNPCNLTMTQDRNVTAVFTPMRSLIIGTTGSGIGVVTSSPAGSSHLDSTVVTITATPGTSSTFVRWEGDCTGTTNPCVLIMDRNRSVRALFLMHFNLTLAAAGSGTGRLSATPPGATQFRDSTVTILAIADTGSVFIGWRDDCATATANPCTVTMTSHRTVTGVFNPSSGVRRYDGAYAGTWTGQQSSGAVLSGPISFTVSNGVLQGTAAPISGSQPSFAGTVSATGAVTVRIAAGTASCAVDLAGQITTSVTGGIERATASGSYTLVPSATCNAGSGTWTLTR